MKSSEILAKADAELAAIESTASGLLGALTPRWTKVVEYWKGLPHKKKVIAVILVGLVSFYYGDKLYQGVKREIGSAVGFMRPAEEKAPKADPRYDALFDAVADLKADSKIEFDAIKARLDKLESLKKPAVSPSRRKKTVESE